MAGCWHLPSHLRSLHYSLLSNTIRLHNNAVSWYAFKLYSPT